MKDITHNKGKIEPRTFDMFKPILFSEEVTKVGIFYWLKVKVGSGVY